MLDDNIYNIMEQLVTENLSLWHIKNYYMDDASKDNEIKQVWNFVEKTKKETIELLLERLKERLHIDH